MGNFDIITEAEAVKKTLNTFESTRNLDTDKAYNLHFSKITDALTTISNLEKSYFEVNELGEYKKADRKTVEGILLAYEELKNAIKEVSDPQKRESIKKTFTEKNFADAYFDTIDYVGKLVDKDITALSSIDRTTDNLMELPKAIESGRSIKLALNDKSINIVGGASSERIPVKYIDEEGREHKGYFTKDTKVDYAKEMDEKIRQMLNSFWPQDLHKKEVTNKVFNNLMKIINSDEVMKDPAHLHYILVNLPNLLSDYKHSVNKKITSALFESEHQFDEFKPTDYLFKNRINIAVNRLLRDKFAKYIFRENDSSGYYIKKSYGSSISQRNCAMSSVAKLLGVERVICHSENMTVNINGIDYSGVFMKNAEGEDIAKALPRENDPFFKCLMQNGFAFKRGRASIDADYFDNEKVIKDIADLQVLDFVCNNIDRHGRNYSYIFSDDGSKIIGIQGFDNDLSFGTTINGERTKDCIAHNALFLSDLQIITKSMADTLRKRVAPTVNTDVGIICYYKVSIYV